MAEQHGIVIIRDYLHTDIVRVRDYLCSYSAEIIYVYVLLF